MNTDAQEAYAYCRKVTRQHAKNFYYAFLFLPKAQRDAIYTVYAFCRYCDDIADDDHTLTTQHTLLQDWRRELDNCYAGKPTHRITQALQQTVAHYAIPKHYFEELICGVEMDLAVQRYATFSELEQYCYRVASVVGLACLPIFGATTPGCRAMRTTWALPSSSLTLFAMSRRMLNADGFICPLRISRPFSIPKLTSSNSVTPGLRCLDALPAAACHRVLPKGRNMSPAR